ERAPQGGDAVVERRPPVGVDRDVAHGEVEGEEGVDQEEGTRRDEDRDADGRALGRLDESGLAATGADGGGDAPVQRQDERRDGGGVADLGDVHRRRFYQLEST